MAVFEYTAKDPQGYEFSGVYTDVGSAGALRTELSKMGYTLVKARYSKKKAHKKQAKVSLSNVVTFAYEFSGMYSAGLSIVRCLETFESQTEDVVLKTIITDVREHIETGSSMKEAFEKYRHVFSDFFVAMIEVGEAGGKLGETLNMAAVYLEKQAKLKNSLRGAFAYPIVVCSMCIAIVSALVVFVIPVFQKLYTQLHVPLPLPTLTLIVISKIVRNYWWIALPVILLTVFMVRKLAGNPSVKRRLDSLKLNMPILGRLNRLIVVSRFVRTFAMMSSAGVPVVDALELAKHVSGNGEMEKAVEIIRERVITGDSLARPMSECAIFPPMIVQLAAAGEEAGVLPEMLNKGVDFLDIQIEMLIKSLLVKIEPVLSIVLGLVVGGILMGVYLPMFDYMGHVK